MHSTILVEVRINNYAVNLLIDMLVQIAISSTMHPPFNALCYPILPFL